jgi:hypothetical protein
MDGFRWGVRDWLNGGKQCNEKGSVMKAYQVFQELYRDGHAKRIMADMKLSRAMVYRWSEQWDRHTVNPLDRLAQLIRCTDDRRLIDWLSREAGGTFVPDVPASAPAPVTLVPAQCEVVKETAVLLEGIAESAQDGNIAPAEAEMIRVRWQRLKSVMEGFVMQCERGTFRFMAPGLALGWWLATGEVGEMEGLFIVES